MVLQVNRKIADKEYLRDIALLLRMHDSKEWRRKTFYKKLRNKEKYFNQC